MINLRTVLIPLLVIIPSFAYTHPNHGNQNSFTINHFLVLFIGIILAIGITSLIYFRKEIVAIVATINKKTQIKGSNKVD